MSAIATLHVVRRDLVADERMPVHRAAEEFGREVDPDVFPYSGYLMLDITPTRLRACRESASDYLTELCKAVL